MLRWLGLLGILLIFFGCAPKAPPPPLFPTPRPKATQRPYRINGKTYYPLPSAQGYVEVGYASWYGPKFHGRPTASGEPYNMYAFTAAHKLLPLGTYVLVTNLENGRRVVVRINDRGPFVKDRIIDLSYAAAKALGMVQKGVARVRLVALAEGYKKQGHLVFKGAEHLRQGQFFLQVGSFVRYTNAVRLREMLAKHYQVVLIEPFVRNGRTFYRVQVFLANDLNQARQLARHLEKKFPEAFLVAR